MRCGCWGGQDIAAHRLHEQQVLDSERLLRELSDKPPVRIAHLDHERFYSFVNSELLHHLERDKSEVIGRARAAFLLDADETQMATRASVALAGRAQQFEFEAPW